MSMVKEFKEFIMRGNVIDLAVGIVIGAAFGKVVSSLVADIIMPPLGLLIGGVNFTDLKVVLGPPLSGGEPVTLNYGNFIQVLFDFVIVAFAIFLVVKMVNRLKRKQAEAPAVPPAPTKDQVLLTEIRDLLKARA
ncbi:MAG TPA: large-conductance mechanosensitive channel protein MscL [Candidatus Krumholzibacteria bacterium]|nr:large-conductance mechanosensitive channel protein MscL [Candidatus Krumholzibacteria bacterium]